MFFNCFQLDISLFFSWSTRDLKETILLEYMNCTHLSQLLHPGFLFLRTLEFLTTVVGLLLFILSHKDRGTQRGLGDFFLGFTFFCLSSLGIFVTSVLIGPYFHPQIGCLAIVMAR